ncbi:hypothetical protein CEUSTIGMA_g10393.t1 [Chlamydomonas eustigma]|uniref:Transmembrane protein n=1 Tax=Chlamydomonas eustigma TaxID=1157962 RepID=A0A250XIX1_9CHLO|nr:hypothetical protein CEUSTIGMA_g10393.t1 [Chlamydomonas eustigma]|eukprot:GAX82966.1 hypothetical protein CEUSTIGMA_g10393.t1 [Chlamydomonas eustigma]
MLGDTVNDKRSNQTSSASNQQQPPLIRSSTESWVFWHGIFVLVHLFILLRTLKLLSQSWRQLDLTVLLGYIVTSAAEVVIIWNSVSFSVAVRKGNQYMDQIVRDRSLLLVAVLMPLINALYCFTLPFFDVTNRNWFVFYVVTLILLRTNREDDNWLSENGGILRFSQVSYSLAHWMLCSPVFALLDCYKSIKLMSDVTTADGVEAVPADGSQLTTLSLTMIATQGLLFLMKTFLVLCIYMTLAVRSPSPVSPPEALHEEEGDTRMTRPSVAPSCTVMTRPTLVPSCTVLTRPTVAPSYTVITRPTVVLSCTVMTRPTVAPSCTVMTRPTVAPSCTVMTATSS